MYEILLIEAGIYYIRYYSNGMESKGVDLKLSRENYLNWQKGKIEK